MLGRDQLHRAGQRARHQRLESLDLRVQPERLEPRENQLGDVMRPFRAGFMRLGGEETHLRPQGVARGNRAQLLLVPHLGGDGGCGEAANRSQRRRLQND